MSPMVRLRPTARPVRRGTGEVQFGLTPERGIVLAGLNDQETELLLSLAETSGTGRDVSLAHRFGVPLERVEELVTALRGHGLLVDPAAPGSPSRQIVSVCGRGVVVDQLRRELTATELVGVQDAPTEPPGDDVALAVLCARDAVALDQGTSWQRAGTPHLPVVLRDEEVVIGPLVQPGRSPCLRCLDLHRSDRDRAWPRILTQLSSPAHDLMSTVDAPATHVAVISSVVAMIVLEALTSSAGEPPPHGVSWQISLPWPDVRTRVWKVHPHCSCAAG